MTSPENFKSTCISMSSLMVAPCRSRCTEAKEAFTSAPSNTSPPKFRFCPPKVAFTTRIFFPSRLSVLTVGMSVVFLLLPKIMPSPSAMTSTAKPIFQNMSQSMTFCSASRSSTPTPRPIAGPVLSLFPSRAQMLGTMMKSVHQPLNRILMWRQMHTIHAMPHTTNADPQMTLLFCFMLFLYV